LFVLTGGALVGLVPSFAAAQDAGVRPVVTVSGSCPESSAVESVLAGLLPPIAPVGTAATATVSDRGDSYVVAIDDRVKAYADVTRDCAERARVAAAFISLALVPDPTPVEAKAPEPAPEPIKPVEPTPNPTRWGRIDWRGTYTDAPASGLLAPGLALGVAAGIGRFGGQAVCGWVAESSLSVANESGTVMIERFPCALGPLVRLSPPLSALEVNAAASAVFGALRATGTGFASSYNSLRLEVGARVAVDATLHIGRRPGDLAPVIGLELTYDPMTYDLAVVPRGIVGQTPSLWIGISAGFSWSIP
jgi:hypothetical protein